MNVALFTAHTSVTLKGASWVENARSCVKDAAAERPWPVAIQHHCEPPIATEVLLEPVRFGWGTPL